MATLAARVAGTRRLLASSLGFSSRPCSRDARAPIRGIYTTFTKGGAGAGADGGDRKLFCVVGSGPAGMYAADRLLSHYGDRARVDVLERLPTPFGLVRSGVAPDHAATKSVTNRFDAVLADPRVAFLGNVALGRDVSVDDLTPRYHAVVLAYGAEGDKTLGVPGEDLRGVHSAREFVGWFNGDPGCVAALRDAVPRALSGATSDPDAEADPPPRGSGSRSRSTTAVIFGLGNVAVDCARMLLRDPAELAKTDVCAHALDALSTSRVRRVVMVGRRGSAQAAFSPKELRELLGLPGVEVKVADPACMRLEPEDEADLEASRPRRRAREAIVKALSKTEAAEADEGGDARVVSEKKTLEFRFLRSPERFEASGDEPGAVGAVTLRVTALRGASGARRAEATEATETLSDVALALRSVGYVARPVTGEDSFKSYVPFDPKRGVVPNHLGRVQEQVAETVWQVPGLYVAGWLKRGPTGIIGTNLHDAEETVGSIVEDDERGILRRPDYRFKGKGVAPLLRTRGVVVVDKEGWRRIDAKERERGAEAGKPREKFVDVAEMLDAAAAGEPEKATA